MYFPPPHSAPYPPFTTAIMSGAHCKPAHCPDDEADITVSTGRGEQPSGLRFDVLDSPEQLYDDAPYIPPRVSQAELPTYPAPDPRAGSVYDPTPQQYPFEGGTSPSDSHHSIESSWSASSSSASSQQVLHEYNLESTSRTPRPPHATSGSQHYPAYRGKDRLGFEHAQYGGQPANTGISYYRTHGYPVDGLLATGPYNDTSAQTTVSSQVNYPSHVYIPATNHPPASSSPVNDSTLTFSDTATYLRQQLGLTSNESVSLHSLPDPPPGEKPSTPLPMLIKLAIYGSPNKQLTLQEIYVELENRFQWFRDHKHERAWKNSIRHNLSLNKVFVHVPRPITEPGKGSYWRLDVSGGEGYKRTRKRRPKNRLMVSEEEEEISEAEDERPSPLDPSQPAGPSGTPFEDVNIDPELRGEGHVVREGRTRSATRRAAGSPYPQQSPRYQQGPLPAVAGQDTTAPGQPSVRFGQPSFNFPTYSQPRPMPLVTIPPASAYASPPMTMGTTSPMSIPRGGIEYVGDSRSQLATRHRTTQPESGEQTQGNVPRSNQESASGSSRTWRGARSGS